MGRRTALFEEHRAAGAKMVEFAGWEMPLNYGSQVAEHRAVRSDAGVFDVSHMTVIDIAGAASLPFLRRMLAGDAARLQQVGQALYTTLLNDAGGVIDDLILYRLTAAYRLVVNASTRNRVLNWLRDHAAGDLSITDCDLAILAVQGPKAVARFVDASGVRQATALKRFNALAADDWLIARTGYTGEDGLEIMLPNEQAPELWRKLLAAGATPAGLGARDTLRLEAGLNLYGQDMDETTSPLVANLGWTIHWRPDDRDFVGRAALQAERDAGVDRQLTGLALDAKGVMRAAQRVLTEAGEGSITSGVFSPTLGCSIALARLPAQATGAAEVLIRDQRRQARIVQPPFVARRRQ